ncbi:MAG: hypothetical protein V4538_15075 [Bacteroidota bacterium]
MTKELREQHHAKIVSAIEVLGECIGEQIAEQAKMDYHAVMRRLKELVDAGKIYNTLKTGLTSTGRKANKYAIRNENTVIPVPEKFNPTDTTLLDFASMVVNKKENVKIEKETIITKRLEQIDLFSNQK